MNLRTVAEKIDGARTQLDLGATSIAEQLLTNLYLEVDAAANAAEDRRVRANRLLDRLEDLRADSLDDHLVDVRTLRRTLRELGI